MAPVILAVMAVGFLGMGLVGLVAPARLIATFGVTLPGPDARSEVRAVYGGFGVAIAGLLAVGACDVEHLRGGIAITVGTALAGMAFGRLVGRLVERPTGFYPVWCYFAVETVGAAALFLAAKLG